MASFHLSPDQQGVAKVASYRTQVPGLTAKGDRRQFVQHNYTDHSNEQGDVNFARRYNLVCFDGDKQVEEDSSKQDATAQILQSPTFPLKLHMILDKIEDTDSSMKNAISWLPHGRAFHIRNSDIFKREVLPKYFKNCKMSSFYRQINLYGFVRLTTGCETGAYYHEYFLRGRAFLTKNIIRTKVKGTKIRPTSAPEDEPNFYAMTPVCSTEEDNGINTMPTGMPLGVVTPHAQSDNSVALLQAIRDMERIKHFGNAMPYASQQTMQNSFMGSMAAAPNALLNGHSLSLFDRSYLPDSMRPSFNDASRTAMQHEMSRVAVHNEMSRATLQSEMSRAAVQNELSRSTIHNDMSRAAVQNEIPRMGHNEMSRTAYNEAPTTGLNETPTIAQNGTPITAHSVPSAPNCLTQNSYTEELKMIAQMLRASDMRVQSKVYHNPNQA